MNHSVWFFSHKLKNLWLFEIIDIFDRNNKRLCLGEQSSLPKTHLFELCSFRLQRLQLHREEHVLERQARWDVERRKRKSGYVQSEK